MSVRIKDKTMKEVLPNLRKDLKEAFPQFTLSVKGEYLTYKVAFMKGKFKFQFIGDYQQHYSYKLITTANMHQFPEKEQSLYRQAFKIAEQHEIPVNRFQLTVGQLDKPYRKD